MNIGGDFLFKEKYNDEKNEKIRRHDTHANFEMNNQTDQNKNGRKETGDTNKWYKNFISIKMMNNTHLVFCLILNVYWKRSGTKETWVPVQH